MQLHFQHTTPPLSAMKKVFPVLLLFTTAGTVFSAESVAESDGSDKIRYQLILPEEKTPEVVKPNETNPFNKSDGNTLKPEDASSEENKIKDQLLAMRVSGVVTNTDGSIRAVMLGEMKLERGMIVPQVVPDQAAHLRVNSLSESTIELFWIERKRNVALPPRPVIIPVNLKPFVRYKLPKTDGGELLSNKRGGSVGDYGFKTAPGAVEPLPSQESRRATVVDESGPSGASSPAVGNDPRATSPGQDTAKQPDEKHPANLLMNLFLNKAVPTTQQAPAQEK